MKRNETIGSMAARFRMWERYGVGTIPLRYHVAARIYADNVAEHPEIASMTWADARDFAN